MRRSRRVVYLFLRRNDATASLPLYFVFLLCQEKLYELARANSILLLSSSDVDFLSYANSKENNSDLHLVSCKLREDQFDAGVSFAQDKQESTRYGIFRLRRISSSSATADTCLCDSASAKTKVDG